MPNPTDERSAADVLADLLVQLAKERERRRQADALLAEMLHRLKYSVARTKTAMRSSSSQD